MTDFDPQRARLIAVAVGLVGVSIALLLATPRDAVGFALGAAISIFTLNSWVRLAGSLDGSRKRSLVLSALFLIMRYALIGVAIYAIINRFGTSPVALIVGLLVSFAAVILELLYQYIGFGNRQE